MAALEAYRQAGELQIADAYTQWKLALLLYDGRHYPEALDAMTREQHLAKGDLQFGALVWQGHILDLLGRRSEAVARYEEALKMEGSPSIRHDQYNMTINKQRVEDRVKTPFERK